MARFADLRRYGLALPEVVEHPHMEQPCLRARGKMFALWSEENRTTIMKLDRAHQDMLFEVSREIFTPCPVGTGMWSYVDISKLKSAELKSLVTEAWSQVVPKKMRGAISTSAVAPRPERPSKAAAATHIAASAPSPSRRRKR